VRVTACPARGGIAPLRGCDQEMRAAVSAVIFTRLCVRTPCPVQIRAPLMPSSRVRSYP